jgi:uncharacterized membrane protein SpoIIM required for sporulation
MKVSDLLVSRAENWRELDRLCQIAKGRSQRKLSSETVVRLGRLYRDACADLALADAYQFPPGTVAYLHQLVGQSHNQLYRSRTFQFGRWSHELLVAVPRRLYSDVYLRLAFCIFWGLFILSAALAYRSPEFAEHVVTKEKLAEVEDMYSTPVQTKVLEDPTSAGTAMVGFYIWNNVGIGLRCFAFGLVYGIGGLFATVFNAAFLGAMFGHMATTPQRDNFFEFVTAHGPLELTAVVLSAAAGMRLGFSLLNTGGLTRIASLRRAGVQTMPIMGVTIVMFALAALVEGLLSPSPAPYWVKASVAIGSGGMLLFYIIGLGYPGEARS